MIKFPFLEIFDGLHKQFFDGKFHKKIFLMDYVIRSCDLSKNEYI